MPTASSLAQERRAKFRAPTVTWDLAVLGAGCGVAAITFNTYGTSSNNITSGIYATEWTLDHVKIWFFPRNAIPADIASGHPNPSSWGLHQANLAGASNIDTHLANHQAVFGLTFCGDWGATIWAYDGVCNGLAPTCNDYVANNQAVFKEAYWSLDYLKVFNLVQATILPSPTSTASSTSAKSSRSSEPQLQDHNLII